MVEQSMPESRGSRRYRPDTRRPGHSCPRWLANSLRQPTGLANMARNVAHRLRWVVCPPHAVSHRTADSADLLPQHRSSSLSHNLAFDSRFVRTWRAGFECILVGRLGAALVAAFAGLERRHVAASNHSRFLDGAPVG